MYRYLIRLHSTILKTPQVPLSYTLRVMERRVLVADWDETVTVKDTTKLVADVAYKCKSGLPEFSHFSKIYTDALYNYDEQYKAEHGARNSLEKEMEYQKGLKAVEMTSISALVQQRIFQSLARVHFAEAAKHIELRPGFVEFAKKLFEDGTPLYILSINWCRTMIEETLKVHGVKGFTVLANDLEFDSEGVTTGRFEADTDIRTGFDKMIELEKIRKNYANCSIVYVGDSLGDVLPLSTSNIGIIIAGGKAGMHFDNVTLLKAGSNLQSGVYEAEWGQLHQAW